MARAFEAAAVVAAAAVAAATFFAALCPVNEYAGFWGGPPPLDCDGPTDAALVIAPFAAATIVMTVLAVLALRRRRSVARWLILSLAIVSSARVALKASEIAREQIRIRFDCR